MPYQPPANRRQAPKMAPMAAKGAIPPERAAAPKKRGPIAIRKPKPKMRTDVAPPAALR